MTRIGRRRTKINRGMCEHGCCDWCPGGCFDEPSDLEIKMYEELQKKLRERMYCVGWHKIDSQKITYYDALFDSWHEAANIARDLSKDPTIFAFVSAVIDTKDCPRCGGTGNDPLQETGVNGECGHCHGKGKVRA